MVSLQNSRCLGLKPGLFYLWPSCTVSYKAFFSVPQCRECTLWSQHYPSPSHLLESGMGLGFLWLLCLCLSCCFGVLFDVIFPLLNRCSLQSPFFRVQCSLRIGIDSVWRWEEGFRLSLPCRLLISLLSCEPPLIFSSSLFTP